MHRREQEFRYLTDAMPQIVFSANAEGINDYYNVRWFEYTGLDPQAVTPDAWTQTVHPDDMALIVERWEKAQAEQIAFEAEYRLKRADGIYQWHLGRSVPLKNTEGKIERWIGTATNIDEQRRAAETQKELSNLKNLFLSITSHELRTPLTAIRGFAQLIERTLNNQAKNAPQGQERRLDQLKMMRNVQNILRQTGRMNEMVVQLLEFSRLQTNSLQLNYNPALDLSELVERVVEQQRVSADKHHLESIIEEKPLSAMVDEARLEQVLNNLVSNAVKYSPSDTLVQVGIKRLTTSPSDSAAVIWVQDQGYGIDQEHQAHLFDPFYRVQTTQTVGIEGTGLGLYISYQIIKQHGGRMWLESTPGQGSTFYFSIPLTPTPDLT